MITQDHDSITLMQQQANQSLVDDLYRRGFINQQARDSVLELLYPHRQWGYWTARLLTILGCVFVLAGMVYYFAFNWESMSDSYKLITIQTGIFCSIAGAWAYTLDRLPGQLFLTSACLLIGIFMAVFGQIYQTGADAYELFCVWALLILPWVLISKFAPVWFIWIIIVNTALILFWSQAISLSPEHEYFIYFILIVLNACFLALREHFSNNNVIWLQEKWQRLLLAIGILLLTMAPIETIIIKSQWDNVSLILSAILGAFVLIMFLIYYRLKQVDMWTYSLTIMSICIIFCTGGFKVIDNMIQNEELEWLLMSIITLIIFTLGAYLLRKSSLPIIFNKDKLL